MDTSGHLAIANDLILEIMLKIFFLHLIYISLKFHKS